MCRTRFQNRRIDPKISSNRQTNKEWDGQKEKNNKCHTRSRTIFRATTSRGGNKIQFVLICAIFPTYYEPGRWLPTSTRHQDGLSWNRGQSCRDTLR